MVTGHCALFHQIDKNYFSDSCAKIEAMSRRDSDQNLYKVQDCTTFFSYTPSFRWSELHFCTLVVPVSLVS